jgi:hypothetical protein
MIIFQLELLPSSSLGRAVAQPRILLLAVRHLH